MSEILEESSIISEEIRDEVNLSGSGIADEIATMSIVATSAMVSRSKQMGGALVSKGRND